MKFAAILLPAAIAGGVLALGTAHAESALLSCDADSGRAQLVCGAEGCLRIETRRICEGARSPAMRPRQIARRLDPQEQARRDLTRLIASLD